MMALATANRLLVNVYVHASIKFAACQNSIAQYSSVTQLNHW